MRDLLTEGDRGLLTARFWSYFDAGSLHLQRCDDCGFVRYPPSLGCPSCGAARATWVDLGRRGTLRSWTVTHPVAGDRLPRKLHAEVPYVLGLLEFSGLDGFLLPVRVDGVAPESLRVGLELEIRVAPDRPRRIVAASVTV